MTCQDVFHAALRLCGECNTTACSDYLDRAPYLIATLCAQCADLDKAFRIARGKEGEPYTPTSASLALNTTFPLCAELEPAVAYSLGALLCLEENEDLSASLAESARTELSRLRAQTVATSHSIRNVYPNLI